jgi:hypothetical protein
MRRLVLCFLAALLTAFTVLAFAFADAFDVAVCLAAAVWAEPRRALKLALHMSAVVIGNYAFPWEVGLQDDMRQDDVHVVSNLASYLFFVILLPVLVVALARGCFALALWLYRRRNKPTQPTKRLLTPAAIKKKAQHAGDGIHRRPPLAASAHHRGLLRILTLFYFYFTFLGQVRLQCFLFHAFQAFVNAFSVPLVHIPQLTLVYGVIDAVNPLPGSGGGGGPSFVLPALAAVAQSPFISHMPGYPA